MRHMDIYICTNRTLKYIPTRVHSEVAPWQGVKVKDLMVVSAVKWCSFLSVGAKAACKNVTIQYKAASSGQDYTQAF